ncbi:MAG: TonB-dependent receptor [Saprospiraceae bacterium]|nr:TonB-dependent receptor [Saprospiraceae bacterium]
MYISHYIPGISRISAMRYPCTFKRSFLFKLLLFVLFFIQTGKMEAQSFLDQKIAVSFSGQTMTEILEQIDRDFAVDIYFDPAQLPAEKYQLGFRDISLRQFLEGLLKDTGLGFALYEDYAIIIAPVESLDLEFTQEYFQVKYGKTEAAAELQTEEIVQLGDPAAIDVDGKAKIQGQITDAQFGDPLIGVSLYIPKLNKAVITDGSGKYSWELPIGEQEVLIQSIGYEESKTRLQVYGDGTWDLALRPKAYNFEAVVISETATDENISSTQIGLERLSIREIKALPALMGESDVIQSLLTLPGITSVGEGATGFNVRGGSIDQNLVTQDGALVFNSSHVLGFFSIFNADLIQGVSLYKGNIPAQYGGRIASFLEVETIDPDPEKFHIRGGVGIVSSKLTLEVPIIKGSTSLLVGARSSYTDWMLKAFRRNRDIRTSSATFYDLNAKITQQLGGGSNISIGFYRSQDEFQYSRYFGFKWGLQHVNLQWNQILADWLSSNLEMAIGDSYNTSFDPEGVDAFELDAGIRYYRIKENFFFNLFDNQQIHFGAEWLRLDQSNETLNPGAPESAIIPVTATKDRGEELSFYLNDEITLSPRISLSAGIRYTIYKQKGPESLYQYAGTDLPDLKNLDDTLFFEAGQIVQNYQGWEPRLSVRYRLDVNTSLKFSYNQLYQYIHLISNTVAATPVDVWQLSTPYVPPQKANNFSFGVFRNFKGNNWETSLEGFYRILDQLVEVRDLPQILLNEHLETELQPARGRAYGLELSIKKNTGKTRGRLSYTWSRSLRQTPGEDGTVKINQGDWFASSFDQPHSLKLTLSQQVNRRHTFAANFVYNSGRPITVPIGNFFAGPTPIPLYSDRNAFRIPAYHRLDLSYTIRRNAVRTQRYKGSLTFSIYNVYARKNVFSIFFERDVTTTVQAYKFSVLGAALPAITYNFEF